MSSSPTLSPSHGLTLEVTIHLLPSNVETFLTHFRPAFEAVVAEPECTFFELFTDPENPGTLHWVESWTKSKEWLFEVQLKKEYYKPYFAATEKMFVKERKCAWDLFAGRRRRGCG